MGNEKPAVTYTRPYSEEHARAGAPVGLSNGTSRKIEHLTWSSRKVVGVVHTATEIYAGEWWSETGKCCDPQFRPGWNLVMAPLTMVQERPVFVGDVIVIPGGEQYTVRPVDRPGPDCEWPKPMPKWPVTSLTPQILSELDDAATSNNVPEGSAYTHFANAIIAHECEVGNLVPKAQYMEQSRELGAAERALENAGFRFSNGEWVPEHVTGKSPEWVRYGVVEMIAINAIEAGRRNERGGYQGIVDIRPIIDRNLGRA